MNRSSFLCLVVLAATASGCGEETCCCCGWAEGSNASEAVCEQAEREECNGRVQEGGVIWFGTYCEGDEEDITSGAQSELSACMDTLE